MKNISSTNDKNDAKSMSFDFLLAANIVKSKDNEIPQTYYMIK